MYTPGCSAWERCDLFRKPEQVQVTFNWDDLLWLHLQVRRVHACLSFPPCPSLPVTWEPAHMPVVTINPIGCQQPLPSPIFLWVELPLQTTSAVVWCVKPPPHQLQYTVKCLTSQNVPQVGEACGLDTHFLWWVWFLFSFSSSAPAAQSKPCSPVLSI